MKPAISYQLLTPDRLDVIRPLWEQLNRHHASLPTSFSKEIAARSFETRLQTFRQKAASGRLRIEIATVGADDPPVGYCITSLASDGAGEVDSLFVAPGWRRIGIATRLLQGALDWLRDSGAATRRVTVLHANDEAGAFYRQFGFHPRNVGMELPPGTSSTPKA
ncbi:MAG TPA: GNAT family N-acetyltransferase [Roseimicrobium sp.]|nr:GNAT family N-acetyltransferase [Roseimicrobium sp.]